MPSTVTGVNTNILTFGNLQLEDAGEYQCVAICEFTGSNFSEHAMLTFKSKYHAMMLFSMLILPCSNVMSHRLHIIH